ncbi:hypothetical protein O7635_24120 [Asanoa sp. WMMD1127]|uniref:SPW repeat domain-containing protein n=1 Tax=Asanoa sp. WMMD1127 TaxID=3016107 RepID=UPI002417320C|nr:hypothetical protein [Asanoa sp. WMMD1127]MDG4824947.1 hypothetical protein [Asanoa sp. WMMD1127]
MTSDASPTNRAGIPERPRRRLSRVGYPTVAAAVIALVACWVMVSPFVLGERAAGRWITFVTGLVVLLLAALLGVLTRHRVVLGRALIIAGAWLVVASLAFPMRESLTWGGVLAGVLIASLALAGQTRPPAGAGRISHR